jgi:hypothetical protein
MALIACPECRRQVSDKAAACPNCGHPIAASADYPRQLIPDDLTAAVQAQSRAGDPTRSETRASREAWKAEERIRKQTVRAAQKDVRRGGSAGIGKSVLVAAVIGGGLGLYFVLGSPSGKFVSGSPPGKDEKKIIGCASDWRQCKDNADFANNYGDILKIQIRCKSEAEKIAKYGTPKFPWLYFFATFLKGDSYPKTGIVVLLEKDAQFSNAFGAMVHSTVTCSYDLDLDKVSNVSIAGN